MNRKTKVGSTALIAAAESGDPALVRTLLGAGADPRTETKGGATAMTNARGPQRDEIVALLDRAAKAPAQGCVRSSGAHKQDIRGRRGARDFLEHVHRGQPEWTLVAAQADVERVAAILGELHEATAWEKDAALRPVIASRRFTFAVRLRGHDWTVAPLSVGWARLEVAVGQSRRPRVVASPWRSRVFVLR